jgi:hypothetical protein
MFEKEDLIDLNVIDLDNKTYSISSDLDIANLRESIRINGLINPCILMNNNNNYIVVSGHRRIKIIKELGFKKVPAKVVIEKKNMEQTNLFCSKLSIIENAFHRELDLIELSRGVALLNRFMTNDEIVKKSPSIFNTKFNRHIVNKLLKIASMISSNKMIYNLIDTKKISMITALKIYKSENQILNSFINIFQKVRMGQNKQLEVITHFYEIAKREDIPLHKFLNSKDILEIIGHENTDENYKGNLLRSYLSKKRYPVLTKAYEDHKKGIKNLKLEPGIKLNPPNNFEADKHSLSFEFRNKEEFKAHLTKLVSINTSEAFENLIK